MNIFDKCSFFTTDAKRELIISHHHLILKMIKEILDSFDSLDSAVAVAELQRYKADFYDYPDYNFYKFGNLRIYFSDIRAFFLESGYKFSDDDDDDKIELMYMSYVRAAIDEILEVDEKFANAY